MGMAGESTPRLCGSHKYSQYTSLREDWATVPLGRQEKIQNSGLCSQTASATTTGKNSVNIATAHIKEIKTEFSKLKSAKVTLDGNRSFTVKEAIRALAPTLERMKKRGFDIQEFAENFMKKHRGETADLPRQRPRSRRNQPAPPRPTGENLPLHRAHLWISCNPPLHNCI